MGQVFRIYGRFQRVGTARQRRPTLITTWGKHDMTNIVSSTEFWRDIPGWEGFYQASSLGRVKSLDRVVQGKDGRGQRWQGRILKQAMGRGRLCVFLQRPDHREMYWTHRVVCLAFHGDPPQQRMVAAHWDGDKFNNKPDNLRWATHAENTRDALRHGTFRTKANGHKWTKYSLLQEGEMKKEFLSGATRKEIIARYGVSAAWLCGKIKAWHAA